MQVGLGDGHDVGALALDLVGHTDRDAIPAGQHVKLGEEQVRHRVDHDSLLHQRGVEPTTATRTLRRHAVFATLTAQALAVLVKQLGRERPLTNAGGVGLGDADDAIDARRPDS